MEKETNYESVRNDHQLFFDALIHDHLLSEVEPAPIYDHALLHDADVSVSEYCRNTSTWD